MNEDAKKAVLKSFIETVKSQIAGNPNHGWGVDDSTAVIEATIAADSESEIARLIAEKKSPTLYTPTEFAMSLVKKVVNPSAYRQVLEKTIDPATKRPLLNKAEKGKMRAEEIDYFAQL